MPSKSNPKPRNARRPALAHQVRIIGGAWKRTPLAVIDAAGLRPTPDRVRETVFNWLTHLRDGEWSSMRCLDLFAGSGALGFEAASRGAAQVLLVEDNIAVVRQLEMVKQKLGADQVTILRADARSAAQQLQLRMTVQDRYHLIFLDPPYHAGMLAHLLPACVALLAPGGLVYLEAERSLLDGELPDWAVGWEVVRADRAGLVFFHLLQRESAPQSQA